MRSKPDNPVRGVLRSEIRVLLKLYPVFRRYVKDRKRIKREKEHVYDPRIEYNGLRAMNAFVELGPTFIKLGQMLSARPDLLPNEYVSSFQKLQDDVPAADFAHVKPILERNLGELGKTFEEFDQTAVSGASLGQVYTAVYKGRKVAVKVNRPYVKQRLKKDLVVLKRLVKHAKNRVDSFLYISLENVINDFSSRIFDELDYRKEKSNMERIRKNISKRENVIIPEIVEELSGEEVLVMQHVEGVKITDVQELRRRGYDTARLAFSLDLMFIRMVLKDDIFHGDPHPGNISVSADGKLILYDFGMVGTLDENTRENLIALYVGMITSDADVIIDALVSLNALSPAANRGVIRRSIELSIANLKGINPEESEIRELFAIANEVIFEFPFRLPRALVLYMRMASLLEGICRELDRDFRFIRVLRQILYNEGVLNEFYRSQLIKFAAKSIMSIEKGLDALPLIKRALEERDAPLNRKRSVKTEISIFLGFALLSLALFYSYFPFYSLILIPIVLAAFAATVLKK